MLKNIDPLLNPDLLRTLRAMGHGDEIAIVDANFPSESAGPKLIRIDGQNASRVLDAVLSVMPLDEFVPEPAMRMEVVGSPRQIEPVMAEFQSIIARHEPQVKLAGLERFAFYARVRGAFAVVATGDTRLYANVLLKKGIIRPKSTAENRTAKQESS
jgi:L-fucose mutarotase